MPSEHQIEPEVKNRADHMNLKSLAPIYAELDSAIMVAIQHARTFCTDDVARALQCIFDNMRTRRASIGSGSP